ncbi:MAG: C25 family cysteine peptidase, partial [Verrucomicrobia bacterium]|nr:C25 family cysteine peptidase [Verrucomicrobiota bacterium]
MILLALGLLQGGWLAVAPAEWEKELAPLVAARAAQGWNARFLALEDALAEETGADAPERLKRRLWKEWTEHGVTHVLLVGDADVMPLRFMALDRVTAAAHDVAFYASDLYYADLARADGSFDDWNASQEGYHAAYYGEVRGEKHKDGPINHDQISYLPELALGRWPVSSLAALRAVRAKTLAWGTAPGPASALLVHADEWVDERPRFGARGDELAAAGWKVARQFFGTPEKPGPQ